MREAVRVMPEGMGYCAPCENDRELFSVFGGGKQCSSCVALAVESVFCEPVYWQISSGRTWLGPRDCFPPWPQVGALGRDVKTRERVMVVATDSAAKAIKTAPPGRLEVQSEWRPLAEVIEDLELAAP